MNEKNILVTGGCGYIGSMLVPYLLQKDSRYEIRVIDNLMYGQNSLLEHLSNRRVNFYYGSVEDYRFCEKHYDWADFVIPLAAIVGMPACEKNKELSWKVNSDAIQDLPYENLKIIFPTSNSGYGNTDGSLLRS